MSDKNIINDLKHLIADLEAKPIEFANEIAHQRLLTLADSYRPKIQSHTDDDLRRAVAGMSDIDATKHLRGMLSLGLRESFELWKRLKQAP